MKEDFPVTTTTATPVILVPVADLEPAEDNLRGHVGDVAELARSIAGIGVIEPLLVTLVADAPDRYRIVAGHRRHAAASRAGLEALPCIVRDMTDAERIEVMLVENLQRSDGIPVLAEATGYFRLVGEHGYTIRRLAKQVGRSERHVRSRLALLELPAAAQDALERNELSVGQAEALLPAKDQPDVIEALLAAPEWQRRDMEHAVTEALRRAEHEGRRATMVDEVKAGGTRVIESEGHRPRSYTRLSDLGLAEDEHGAEPCHAAVVESGYGGPAVVAVCTDRRRHSTKAPVADRSELQVDPATADPAREQAKERRRLADRRREFIAARISGRLPRPATVALLVGALLDRANSNDARHAGTLLGATPKAGAYGDDWHGALGDLASRGEPDRLRVGVALAGAMAEARVTSGFARGDRNDYLWFLQQLGYEPDPAESPAGTTSDSTTDDAPNRD
jgi:ParB/RepB/Spo0J family partition protein